MRVYGRPRPTRRRRAQRRRAIAGVSVLVLLVGGVVGAHALLQSGHIVGGVAIGGIDVGGQDRAAATAALQSRLAPRLDDPITVLADGISATVIPSQLGIRLDSAESVRRALALGRLRGSLFPFGYHASVQPVLRLPASFVPPAAFDAATKPPVDARLVVSASGRGRVLAGRHGVGFAPRGALAAIAAAALAGRGEVRLRTQALAPGITTAIATAAKARLARMIGAPILLSRAGNVSGELPSYRLGPLVQVKAYRRQIGVSFDPARVGQVLKPYLRGVLRPARDASWKAVGDHAVVLGSLNGIALDARTTARHMTQAGLIAEPTKRIARLGFTVARPTLTTKQAKALHISQRVSTFTSDMGSSSPNRIHNVHLLADLLNGHIIQPSSTFSFNQVVGPRTADRGFLEGQAIENGVLVPSIGGGVCQVATTVYNAAFSGGYPIIERHNHSFYISHYPLGMDATVADGGPDFVFRNDSRFPILIKTSYTNQTMTVAFYSSSTHRTVTAQTGPQHDYTEPKVEYRYDAGTAEGAIVQQTTGERGFDVAVTRTVKDAHGKVLFTATFPSHYVAENIVYFVGHGATAPAGVTVTGAPPGALAPPPGTKTDGGTGTSGTGTGSTDTTGTGTDGATGTGTTAGTTTGGTTTR